MTMHNINEEKHVLILKGVSAEYHGVWCNYGKDWKAGKSHTVAVFCFLDHNYLHAFLLTIFFPNTPLIYYYSMESDSFSRI
jgi:hypothetical protein